MARLPLIAAFISALLAVTVPQARAADFIYGMEDAICGHHSVLGAIERGFRHQVTHVPHLPNVGIADFYGARLTRYEPATPYSPIERRYCQANVLLTDGVDRPIWFLIEYGQGFASIGDNVEFCVLGFDRWNVYNSGCRVLR
ncbi:hypothetical protein [Chelativorans sp. Marseille-P2723]|uniref:hypothetical protein n=1 Tax=Chelativorans sp. Marseille-P2723 TaxID=2709133 RepID=UPI0015700328|nr:hypothetical protein [Chelativorans sp. Marseille-P2723]